MCDFHLKHQCFHPNKVERGKIATDCEAHRCIDCTDSKWKANYVREQFSYLQELITLSGGTLKPIQSVPDQSEQITQIFG